MNLTLEELLEDSGWNILWQDDLEEGPIRISKIIQAMGKKFDL